MRQRWPLLGLGRPVRHLYKPPVRWHRERPSIVYGTASAPTPTWLSYPARAGRRGRDSETAAAPFAGPLVHPPGPACAVRGLDISRRQLRIACGCQGPAGEGDQALSPVRRETPTTFTEVRISTRGPRSTGVVRGELREIDRGMSRRGPSVCWDGRPAGRSLRFRPFFLAQGNAAGVQWLFRRAGRGPGRRS